MISREQLETSKAIQRRTGRTFHVATRFLPERTRHPTYVLYAFFRIADEIVDDPDPAPIETRRSELRRLREAALGRRPTDDPVLSAFAGLRERHGIPDREIEAFLDAMASDVESDGYDTYSELEGYLRGSAVAVAYMMLSVMDPEDAETARPHAKALGEAFQLTNFLRDVREDVTQYGRIYLPRATLEEYGVPEADVAELRFSEDVAGAIRAELRRTEARYREGVAGIRHLPEDCRFPVLLAAVLYAEHHRLIRQCGYDVLSATPALGSRDYLRLVARTWWHWQRRTDPEAVFYRVSAVSAEAEEDDADSATSIAAGGDDSSERSSGRTGGRLARFVRSRWSIGRPE